MRKILSLLTLFTLLFSLQVFSQEKQYQLSSHILDINTGSPAKDVKISLSKMNDKQNWTLIDEKTTDENGRVKDLLPQDKKSDNKGIYKLTFYTEPYFKLQNKESFYPFIEVVFEIKDNSHYHVPITLSPFGYSTYRGN
ncbi:hydroxyisourate hydrolase [Bacteroides caecigallinarum]|uniref:hydroxyisourate hydrolase n=1 Tax=Bacteroides caecigallinarum TaxID=1411144 RepID=UPI001F2C8692|nr:hydroxyisourate hydrolase [Bacteroides caecigallinarum]MCF2593954.1 hydroxyisourate hydrolase [Bacteroides caecigallinarum]